MIWTRHKSSYWRLLEFKPIVAEARIVKGRAYWRILVNGEEIFRGEEAHILDAMRKSGSVVQKTHAATQPIIKPTAELPEFVEQEGTSVLDSSLMVPTVIEGNIEGIVTTDSPDGIPDPTNPINH